MKKTLFMKLFNSFINLLILTPLSFIISLIFYALNLGFSNLSQLQNFYSIEDFAKACLLIEHFFQILGGFLLIIIISILAIQLIQRGLNDAISNFFHSIYQTLSLRRFMRQHEKKPYLSETTAQNRDTAIEEFNQSVRKNTIDITNQEILCFIKVPHSQQAQKLLKDCQLQIKEEIGNQNPNYIFSSFIRDKHKLWLHGTNHK